MAEPVTDLLMMFSLDGKDGVLAGSTASVNIKETLNEGFTEGRFFEVEEFGFGMKLDPKDGTKPALQIGHVTAARAGVNAATGAAPQQTADKDFAIWRSVKAEEDEPVLPYRCKAEAFTIKRLVDAATPVLFAHCAKRQTFARAVLIKRFRGHGDTGKKERGVSGGMPKTLTFMRMEFESVILTSMDWSDGEVAMETCRFAFQTFTITVTKQLNDGTAGGQSQSTWVGPSKAKSKS